MTYYTNGAWEVNADIDTCFYIYGNLVASGKPIMFSGGVAVG